MKSITRGIGHLSMINCGFTVILQSRHNRNFQFCLRIGTTGVAHSQLFTGSSIPNCCKRFNSISILSQSANGTDLALTKIGFAFSLSCSVNLPFLYLPSSSIKTMGYFLISASRENPSDM